MRGRWSGLLLRRRRSTTSPRLRSSIAAARFGTSSIRKTPTGITNERVSMSTVPITPDVADEPWVLPDRGTIGMTCLIIAESAIFVIFVVAYIFYLGQSLGGPTPRQVLELPIFTTICLLSSSFTLHWAVVALRKSKVGAFNAWLATTVALGA